MPTTPRLFIIVLLLLSSSKPFPLKMSERIISSYHVEDTREIADLSGRCYNIITRKLSHTTYTSGIDATSV